MTYPTLEERLFHLPDLGEGLTEAEIIEWKVGVGDQVGIDQIVVEVETAKAAVDVPVPYAGAVLRLHAEAGTTVAVGEPLISVGPVTAGATQGDSDGASHGDSPGDSRGGDGAAERYREEERAGSGNVLIGYGTGHAPATRRRRAGRSARARRPAVSAATTRTAEGPGRSGATGGATGGATAPLVISPLVRRLARENGVDLARVTPSGPCGVILRRDVEQARTNVEQARTNVEQARTNVEPARTNAERARTDTGRPSRTEAAPQAATQEAEAGAVQRIPMRGMRRAVAEKLSRSRTEIPDATTWVDVDATGLVQARADLQAAEPDRRIGLLSLLARICVAGLRRFPELNATVDTERGEIVRFSDVHLGFAAQTERGLVVPVVRNAHRMTTAELAAEVSRLTGLARSGGLPPRALTGGTFTLNNYGVFGVDGSTPIINHPEAAILGVGRIVDKPWVVDGALAVRKVAQLSLSFDHRVCDGGVAGGFLRYVADCVERPAILLTDL